MIHIDILHGTPLSVIKNTDSTILEIAFFNGAIGQQKAISC
ncbi:MAG: hypothetical protein UT38_C0031G0002 [Microgenomates group bacterium GW2011_GWA2_39_19]|nr:MAG: hypothetical protein UT38_C0031G0002 [Microgenomates group bacterium GW2011_GWA2_39_19]